jgi:hypothetical protein
VKPQVYFVRLVSLDSSPNEKPVRQPRKFEPVGPPGINTIVQTPDSSADDQTRKSSTDQTPAIRPFTSEEVLELQLNSSMYHTESIHR